RAAADGPAERGGQHPPGPGGHRGAGRLDPAHPLRRALSVRHRQARQAGPPGRGRVKGARAMTGRKPLTGLALAGLGGALLSALGLAGCGPRTQATAPASASDSAPHVETVRARREGWKRVSEAVPAELLPYEKTDLHAKISGFLERVGVDYGDRVKKGE